MTAEQIINKINRFDRLADLLGVPLTLNVSVLHGTIGELKTVASPTDEVTPLYWQVGHIEGLVSKSESMQPIKFTEESACWWFASDYAGCLHVNQN